MGFGDPTKAVEHIAKIFQDMHDDDILISKSKVGNTLAINIDAKSMQFRSLKTSSSAGASSFEHIMP